MPSIRPLYDEFGAEGYYQSHADSYGNPHVDQIEKLLERNFHRFDCSGAVLDFSAGGGEVSAKLLQLGASNVVGCDPFTFGLYEKKIGSPCLRFSFKDVIRNGLPDTYTLIICSFAMHLCPPKDLFSLVWNLLQAAPELVVVTPHKRPELEQFQGIEMAWSDVVENERGKKVRMKAYKTA